MQRAEGGLAVESAGDFSPAVGIVLYRQPAGGPWKFEIHGPVEAESLSIDLEGFGVQVQGPDFAEHRIDGLSESIFERDGIGVAVGLVRQLALVQGMLVSVEFQSGSGAIALLFNRRRRRYDLEQTGRRVIGGQAWVPAGIDFVESGQGQKPARIGFHGHNADITGVDPVHALEQVLLKIKVQTGRHPVGAAVECHLQDVLFQVDQGCTAQKDSDVAFFDQCFFFGFRRRRRFRLPGKGLLFLLGAAGKNPIPDSQQKNRYCQDNPTVFAVLQTVAPGRQVLPPEALLIRPPIEGVELTRRGLFAFEQGQGSIVPF